MTQDSKNGQNLFLPIVLALLLVLFAAAVVWVTQIRPTAVEPAAVEEIPAAEEAAAPAEPVETAVDVEAAIAAINKGGCVACHTIPGVPGAVGQVGPNLSNIGVDAAARREGYSAREYIHESLVEPNAFIAPECPTGPCIAGAMPMLQLEEAEFEAIVNFLVTLGTAEGEVAETELAE